MKRLCSLLLSLALVFTLLPPVSAKGAAWDGSVDLSWYDPAASEYYLSTPAQLAGLAALVNGMADLTAPRITGDRSHLRSIRVDDVLLVGAGGGNVSDTVYTSGTDFAYKTVYLTADLDMGGVYDAASGTWSGPNWTPIGGKFPMLPDETEGDCLTLDTRFNGVLDGQGHTISNLYCDRYAAKGFPYSMAVGLVGFLGGACDNNAAITADFENGWQPAVRDLVIASGSVYGRRMVGGVVGRVGETSNGVIIESCGNRADVRNTDSKGVGGIVGSAWGSGMIRSCYNTGTVSTTYTCPAGGILGTNEGMDVYNCYNAGTIDTHGASYGRGIGGHDSGSYTVENCYYLTGCDDDPRSNGYYKGVSKRITVSCTALSAEEMRSAAFLDALNANGAAFAASRSGGYPVLWFENGGADKTCSVTAAPSEHGTVTLVASPSVPAGTTVSLSAQPEDGWMLDHFTVNGAPLAGSFYLVTEDCAFGAVFKKLRTTTLSFEPSDAYYLAVRRTGWRYAPDGTMVYVTDEPVHSGDTLLEGSVLKLLTHEYEDAVPADAALEYRSGVLYTVSGTEKNEAGDYVVSGAETVTITGERNTQGKTWLSCADKSWYTGRQTVYTLTTAEQLAGLAALVNSGTDFAGVTVRLGADLSLARDRAGGAERLWTPIGTSINRAFRGCFDGQGHRITGLRAYNKGSDSALFGCAVGAEITGLTLCGSAVGEAAASYAAGLIAYADGCTIRSCAMYVDVSASGTHAGGIAAYISNGTRLENCTSYGSVSGASGVGGLVGVSYSGEDRISGCAGFGAVTSTKSGTYGTGGLVGRLAGTLTESANYGAVTSADRYTGGLVGYATARNKTTLTLCRNAAAVSAGSTDERAAAGGLVGYAQNLMWGGCGDTSSGLAPLGRSGNVSTLTAVGELPAFTPVPRPADVVPPVSEAADEPQAAQRPPLAENNAVTSSGTYRIPWFATGTLTVADGLDVTLRGECGPFENLTLSVGKNTRLTLQDVTISGDAALLTLAGGNALTLVGENRLDGLSDTPGNQNPTLSVGGNLTIDGTGSLSLTAQVNNAAAVAAPKSVIRQRGGTVSVFKTDKLGFAGGAFCANGAVYELSGGVFCGRTDSDNVAVLSADSVTVTGGELRVAAEKSPAAVLGTVTLEGCTVTAWGHSGNSAAQSAQYENAAALQTVRSQSGVVWKPLLPFTDVGAEQLRYGDVQTCYAHGWLRGVSDTSFAPDAGMTRAMFVTALHRFAGSPAAEGTIPFTDLTADWYRDAVDWAASRGITTGTAPNLFAPDEPLSVEQAAVLLCRYARGEAEEAPLPDGAGAVSDWAREGVRWAYGSGVLTASDLAEPTGGASRVLLARMLSRLSTIVQ